VFQGQYLPLSLSKRGVPYIKKKEKARKRQVQNKKEPHKKNQKCGCPILPSLQTYPILPGLKTGPILLVRSCRSDLSNFTKAANLSVFTGLKTGPILLVCFARFYQGCELVCFYQD
jgi:hypothetical protein